MNRRATQRASSVLYVIVLSPLILLSLALALEAGALQLQKQRLHSAADMAAVSAGSASANVSDGANFDLAQADAAIRTGLIDNLAPLQADIAGATPTDVSAAATVYVVTAVPTTDPLDNGATLTRPTVEIRMRVPVRSGLLSIAGLPAVVYLNVDSRADIRVIGGSQP